MLLIAEFEIPPLNDPIFAMVIVIIALVGLVRVMAKVIERRDSKTAETMEEAVSELKALRQEFVRASEERRETRRELADLGDRVTRMSRRLSITSEQPTAFVEAPVEEDSFFEPIAVEPM